MKIESSRFTSSGVRKDSAVDYEKHSHLKSLAENLLETMFSAGITMAEAEAVMADLPTLLRENAAISLHKQGA